MNSGLNVGEIDCPSCGGSGDEPGPPGFWLAGSSIEPAQSRLGSQLEASNQMDGEYYSGRYPCADCNGDGKQAVWYDTCKQCGGSGKTSSGVCPRCRGLGFHEPEQPHKTSWYEVIEG